MMVTLNVFMFLAGAGVGIFVCGLIFIWIIAKATRGMKEAQSQTNATNAASVKALEERNKIGKEMAGHLKTIAGWCEENWKRP